MVKNILPKFISAVSILVGVVVIIGWYLDITILTSISPNWIRMKFATAACFIFTGFIVYFLSIKKDDKEFLRYIFLTLCPLLLILIMGTLFLGSIFGFQSGMENIAFVDKHEVATPIFQGRPALPTMINFVLIALAGLFYNFNRGGKKMLSIIGWIVGVLGLIGVVGYVTGNAFMMYEIKGISNAIAIHTTILFTLIGLALVLIANQKITLSNEK